MGTNRLVIDRVDRLGSVTHTIVPDRIEAGTYLIAAAITRGSITLNNVCPEHLTSLLDVLKEAGAEINCGEDTIHLNMHGSRPKSVSITTAIYPGIATDLQAQIMAMNCLATGEGSVVETIFENRFMHVQELQRMGAQLTVNGNTVLSQGVDMLTGTQVMATDFVLQQV